MKEITDVPSLGIFEVDKTTIESSGDFLRTDRNGFLYCRKGFIEVAKEDISYIVKENDVFVYFPMERVRIKKVSEDMKGIVAAADYSFVNSAIRIASNVANYIFIMNHPQMSLSFKGRTRMEELINAIRDRVGECGNPLMSHILDSLGTSLCYQLMYEYFTSETTMKVQKDRNDNIFEKFMQSLNRNYMNYREVNYYAEQQNLSPRYFSSIIKGKTGKSALHWISSVVVNEAKHLLSDPQNSIKDVAFKLGFPNQSFFGRYFHKYSGLSPSEYRSSGLCSDVRD